MTAVIETQIDRASEPSIRDRDSVQTPETQYEYNRGHEIMSLFLNMWSQQEGRRHGETIHVGDTIAESMVTGTRYEDESKIEEFYFADIVYRQDMNYPEAGLQPEMRLKVEIYEEGVAEPWLITIEHDGAFEVTHGHAAMPDDIGEEMLQSLEARMSDAYIIQKDRRTAGTAKIADDSARELLYERHPEMQPTPRAFITPSHLDKMAA